MEYHTNCQCATGADITEMVDEAEEMSLEEFKAALGKTEFMLFTESLGYTEKFPIESDWHVSFWKSTYQGTPCCYADHSRIEYVFI